MDIESMLDIIANNGLAIFLVIYYLFIEHPKIRRQNYVLSESILKLKDKIEELQWSINIANKLDKKIEHINSFEEKHLDNFSMYLNTLYETKINKIEYDLFYILEKNNIQNNKDTVDKDIDNIVTINIFNCVNSIKRYDLSLYFISDDIMAFLNASIDNIKETLKSIIFDKDKLKGIKEREITTFLHKTQSDLNYYLESDISMKKEFLNNKNSKGV